MNIENKICLHLLLSNFFLKLPIFPSAYFHMLIGRQMQELYSKIIACFEV